MLVNNGDLFQLGDHFLLCGDALEAALVKKLLGERRISLILSDPPYGVGYVENKPAYNKPKKNKVIVNDQMQTDTQYRDFTKHWLEAVKPYLTEKNSYYIFNSDKMLFTLREGLVTSGFKFSQLLIWVKNHPVLGRLNYLPQHELIAYGWFGKHAFQKSQDKSVLFYPKPHKSPLHPTMKPVALLRNLILNSSRLGDYVYDPFLGSGSTLIACEQTKRKCLGIELDLKYCQTVITRYQKVTGREAVKL